MKPGDQVKVSARGRFVFTVKDVDEDTGMAMIEVNADSRSRIRGRRASPISRPSRTDCESSSSCRSLSFHLFGAGTCFRYGDRCNHPSSPDR